MGHNDIINRTALDEVSSELQPVLAALLAQCYGDMRLLARKIMTGNQLAQHLQPTELANEVVIRLISAKLKDVANQGHFLATAARTMRQVLIDEARKLSAAKRHTPMFMTIWPGGSREDLIDIGALDSALKALAELSMIRAQIVELRFVLGMTVAETAVVVGLSDRTVNRHWIEARAWLMDYIKAQFNDSLD